MMQDYNVYGDPKWLLRTVRTTGTTKQSKNTINKKENNKNNIKKVKKHIIITKKNLKYYKNQFQRNKTKNEDHWRPIHEGSG